MKGLTIVAVSRHYGDIEQYQLSDGRIIDTVTAMKMIDSGELNGYLKAESKNGEYYIRSMPDDDPTNNLNDLPEINILKK